MVKQSFTEFRCRCTSPSDGERSGRTIEVTIPEIIKKIHDLVIS